MNVMRNTACLVVNPKTVIKKIYRKVQGVPQLQIAISRQHQEEEKNDKN